MPGEMKLSIRDRAAIVGIGQTRYTTGSGVTEHHQAVEAIGAALDDAGLTAKDIDGLARFDIENVNELALLYSMGIPICASSPVSRPAAAQSAGRWCSPPWPWPPAKPTSSSAIAPAIAVSALLPAPSRCRAGGRGRSSPTS
jgi:hypothetical protein